MSESPKKSSLPAMLLVASVFVGLLAYILQGAYGLGEHLDANGKPEAVSFEWDTVTLKTKKAKVTLKVEVAKSAKQLERGLMYRKSLPENTGMIFLFPESTELTFWMKNTYVPLDMLFINEKGIITRVVENTKPLSTRYINSIGTAISVIELSAGSASRLDIAIGDRVIYPYFHE
jgi:uncharacterized membrane protein (UPF0127 family)